MFSPEIFAMIQSPNTASKKNSAELNFNASFASQADEPQAETAHNTADIAGKCRDTERAPRLTAFGELISVNSCGRRMPVYQAYEGGSQR